jgi:peptide chain release factor 1
MKKSMRNKLVLAGERIDEINRELATPDVGNDMTRFRDLTRQHSELTQLYEHYLAFTQAERDTEAADAMKSDPDMEEFALEELADAQNRMQAETALLERLMLPKDPSDYRNIFLEIRAGTGGDESALFAGDLLRMYLRYCERVGWKTEIMSASESDLGGYKEVIVRVEGAEVFGKMKFESGGHRVQRVPTTETQGRIHTSACTVAIMAEPDEVSAIKIDPSDLRIDVYRASGAGGQHVNKTESAVRITHLPTGTVAECQDGRSQHQNKDKAMKVLISRIEDKQRRERESKEAAHRRSLVGSGDRSERIRTYNFPQGRVTDHRINLTLYKLQMMMDGDIADMIDGLVAENQAQQLAEMGEEF